MGAGEPVGPEDDLAAVALIDGIGLDCGIKAEEGRGGVRRRAGSLVVTAEEHRAPAGVTRSIDQRAAIDSDPVGQQLHRAAGLAGAGAIRVDRAAVQDCTGRHAAQQDDVAGAVFHRARLDHAGVVHDAREQGIPGAGGHEDLPAVRPDHAAVFGQAAQHALVHLQVDQAVTAEGQRGGTARAQRDGAEPRGDQPLIADLRAEQHHIAASGRVDRALIGDAARARAAEGALAAVQAGIIQVQGGGDESPDVHLGVRPEEDAVRVEQIDLAVGIDPPEDQRAVGVGDAVDRDGGGRGLDEVHRLQRRKVEALPVERQILARLRHCRGRARLADEALTGDDRSADGIRVEQGGGAQQAGREQQTGRGPAPAGTD